MQKKAKMKEGDLAGFLLALIPHKRGGGGTKQRGGSRRRTRDQYTDDREKERLIKKDTHSNTTFK